MEFLPEFALGIGGLIAAGFGARRWLKQRAFSLLTKELHTFWDEVSCGSVESAGRSIAALDEKYSTHPKRVFRVLVQDAGTWFAVRYQPLTEAEQCAARLLHFVGDGSHLSPYLYASALYTHGCLLIEEGSFKFAAERFSAASEIAKTSYGQNCVYAVPPAVALAWLHFDKNNLEKSAKLLLFGLRSYTAELGAEHPRTARIRALLALVAAAAGLVDEPKLQMRLASSAFAEKGLSTCPDALIVKDALRWLERLDQADQAVKIGELY